MTTATIRALDRAAAAAGGVSDYRLAKMLGIGQQAVSKYRSAERQLDDATAVKVAQLAAIPAAELLAEIAAERSKDASARAHWLRLAELARAACLVAAFSVAILAGSALVGDADVSTYGADGIAALTGPAGGFNPLFNASKVAVFAGPMLAFFMVAASFIFGRRIPRPRRMNPSNEPQP